MDLVRFCVKFSAQTQADWDEVVLIETFQRWIREESLPGVLLDAVDYRHVPAGPGIMLVTHEVNYAMEHQNGYGLSAQRKVTTAGNGVGDLVDLIQRTAQFAQLLEKDPQGAGKVKFNLDRFYFMGNDRLALPNNEAGFQTAQTLIQGAIAQLLPGQTVALEKVTNDARNRLTVAIQSANPITLDQLVG